jgi:hypothetical protein
MPQARGGGAPDLGGTECLLFGPTIGVAAARSGGDDAEATARAIVAELAAIGASAATAVIEESAGSAVAPRHHLNTEGPPREQAAQVGRRRRLVYAACE